MRKLLLSLSFLFFLFLGLGYQVNHTPIAHAYTATSTIFAIDAGATAANVNGGGFQIENANFATDLAADTNTGNTNAPVVSSASYNFAAADVNAKLFVKSGTNAYTYCFYNIDSVASNKATLNATAGQGVCLDFTKGYPTPLWATSTVAGIASSATPTGLTWGIDYSQSTSAINSTTNDLASTNGTSNPCTVTSASRTFGVNDIGNTVHVTGGTNWTQEWKTISNVSAGAAIVLGACGSSATLSSGTWREGGAMSMNSTLDDDLFENGKGDNLTGSASRFMIKYGTYQLGESVSIAAAGGTQQHAIIEGFNTVRGDAPRPSSGNQPYFKSTAFVFAVGAQWDIYYVDMASTGTAVYTTGTAGYVIYCKFTNYSTTAARYALATTGNYSFVLGPELSSIRGLGVTLGNNTYLEGAYIHNTDWAIRSTGGNLATILRNNLVVSSYNNGFIVTTSAATGNLWMEGNTFWNPTNMGTAVNGALVTSRGFHLFNNIISGFATGTTMSETVTPNDGFDDYNDYYNNTVDKFMWPTGANNVSVDPQFTNVQTITGTNATSTTNVLTDTTKDFSVITDDVDWITITSGSGTGFATSTYPIHSHTATTLTLATPDNQAFNITSAGNGTALSYYITYGRDFSIGTNLKAKGWPGTFPGTLTTSYTDIGGVQRQETGGGGTCTDPGIVITETAVCN